MEVGPSGVNANVQSEVLWNLDPTFTYIFRQGFPLAISCIDRQGMEMETPEILVLRQFDYSELIEASSSVSGTSSLESIIMETLGPSGPGLLAVTGVPNVEALTNKLLPLGRKLALMDDAERRRILKDHGLGTDVPLKKPDRCVSSFAAQLNFGQNLRDKLEHETVSLSGGRRSGQPLEKNSESKFIGQKEDDASILHGIQQDDFEQLGDSFKQLGFHMVEVGLLLAQICDRAIDGIELKQTILDSCTAKGRLIHYHSLLENAVFMNGLNAKRTKKKLQVKDSAFASGCLQPGNCMPDSVATSLWQQWHYDYGIFTVLSAPMFLASFQSPTRNVENSCTKINQAAQECPSPDGHTYLKILNDVDGKVMFASAPLGSLIVQVGEAAQILSGGKLRATAHCVCRPAERIYVSRETFVLFLQPSWNKCLYLPKWLYGERMATGLALGDSYATPSTDVVLANELANNFISSPYPSNELEPSSKTIGQRSAERDLKSSNKLVDEIQKIVPSLMSRWKEGQTFAEFARETTRQYYGADGVQSRR